VELERSRLKGHLRKRDWGAVWLRFWALRWINSEEEKVLTDNVWICTFLQQEVDHFCGPIVACSVKGDPEVATIPCINDGWSQVIAFTIKG
jgi:hypothetical protein